VTIEIAAALARDIREVSVIPVLVDEARMPRADQLPASIKLLAQRNAVEVRNAQFGRDVEMLVAKVRQARGEKAAGWWRVPTIAAAGAGAAAILVGWITYTWTHGPTDTRVPTVLGGASWSVTDWPWLVSIFRRRSVLLQWYAYRPKNSFNGRQLR
jgi:hypothetical protein